MHSDSKPTSLHSLSGYIYTDTSEYNFQLLTHSSFISTSGEFTVTCTLHKHATRNV